MLIKRSSRRRCSVKKGALKNFANFARKHLCWSLFFKKLKVYSTLFFCEIYKNFKNTYFEHLWTTASKSLYFFSCSILWIFNIAILFSCQGVVFHNFVKRKEQSWSDYTKDCLEWKKFPKRDVVYCQNSVWDKTVTNVLEA